MTAPIMHDPGDYLAALIAFLAHNAYVLAYPGLSADRIVGRRMANDDKKGPWITAHKAPSVAFAGGLPIGVFNVDVWSYGSTEKNASDLDRRVRAALITFDTPRGFRYYDANVTDVVEAGGPNATRDRATSQPLVVSTYGLMVNYARIEFP